MKWRIKQLLPLFYRSHYRTQDTDGEFNTLNYTTWYMWFGKCFGVKTRQWNLCE